MVSEKVYNLCRGKNTVSSELAENPNLSPAAAVKKLYPETDSPSVHAPTAGVTKPASPEDLQRAYECGNWGPTRPSDLFLQIFHDAISTVDNDPLNGITSPPLLGASGVVPLTIISVLPDICRHMANCIVRAEKEVFLATNYWKSSDASLLITNALRELSRRAGLRPGGAEKIVVKIMYDRGNAKQVFDNRQNVGPEEWTANAVQMPPQEEIPNLDMQVCNYHRPIFGTFHSKFMVVDRKIAILSSNNIQDNDNLEMMTHLEGPIVDSFYDMCLISWSSPLIPPLPSHSSPAVAGGLYGFVPTSQATSNPQLPLNGPTVPDREPYNSAYGEHRDDAKRTLPALDQAEHVPKQQEHTGITNGNGNAVDATVGAALPEHTPQSPQYDDDIAGEVARMQASLQPRQSETKIQALTRHMSNTVNKDVVGDAPEATAGEEMTPLIPHPAHDLIPMALVNRKPWGAPNHSCVHTPQNAAFLSMIRHAQSTIFIQTPNLNASPLLPALLAACRRGVHVYCYVTLGYNDSGELLPFQGGTNEMISHKLQSELEPKHREFLHYHFYVGKDQTRPIHNKYKKRSCHIKLMIVDERIAVQGNANQDTQSWFHSQEVNVLLESEEICRSWIEGLRRNQNTHLYGKVDQEDGIWRDASGKEAEGAMGIDVGRFSWAKGIVGAVQRVRGVGGF